MEAMTPQQWLQTRMQFGIKAGLDNISELCARLGHPQRAFKSVHIVGTNGKGSTSFWLTSVLQAHGIAAGLFTSPHLVSVRERIRIGSDLPINEADFARILGLVQQKSQQEPAVAITFFEALTAVALMWFAEQKVEYAVLEAGIGGRWDSTAIARGTRSVITSIGLDHGDILGTTLDAIFAEKLGIWQQGDLWHNLPAYFDPIAPAWQEQISTQAQQIEGRVHTVMPIVPLDLPHRGDVYQRNANLVLAVAADILGANFQEPRAREVLRTKVWWGRAQILTQGAGIDWVLDGAHNREASQALAKTLTQIYPAGTRLPLLMGVLKTKDPQEIIKPLQPWIREIHWVRTAHEKMRDPAALQALSASMGIKSYSHASLEQGIAALQEVPDVLCVGSLYLIGALVQNFCAQYDSLSWFRQFAHSDENEH